MDVTTPDLSVIVTVFNMAREAPRTLHSLSASHQRDVAPGRYEVIVVDNGSDVPLGEQRVASFGPNFRYHLVRNASPSPAAAMNLGASLARGRWLGLVIDGARLVTPGVIARALTLLEQDETSVVETLGFHLGPDVQNRSVRRGYDAATEDALLAGIDWPSDGYRLFEIASTAHSSRGGWSGPITESNCMFLAAQAFHRHGGYDERFDLPGGGFVNLDFYARVVLDPALTPFRLVGEGSFHQHHGGAATRLPRVKLALATRRWRRQYRRLRGRRYRRPDRVPQPYRQPGPHAGG